ncbi:MAG: CRISPR-associated protein Csx19 [Armatimonadota bacterium]
MNLYICAEIIERGKLPELLRDLHNGTHFRYIIWANWQDIWFETFDPSQLQQVSESEWGRAFGDNAELRWRRDEDGEKFVCRWIFEGVQPPRESETKFPPFEFEVRDETFLLWGMPLWKDNQWVKAKGRRIWYVTRIPRKLVYPISDELAQHWEQAKSDREKRSPLCLLVRFYLRNGQPIFDRFIGLEAYAAKLWKSKGG